MRDDDLGLFDGEPTTGDPMTGDPMTGDPTTGDPTTGDPTTEVTAGAPTTTGPWAVPSPTRSGDGGPVTGPGSGGGRRAARRAREDERRRRRRRRLWPAVAAVLVLGLLGGGFLARDLLGLVSPEDNDGSGTSEVVVKVSAGDSIRAIGDELAARGVVASARAFSSASEQDSRMQSVQPGYYQMRRQMSGSAAVADLLDPSARVGRLEIRAGTQLDDTAAGPGGAAQPGVLSLISRATCARIDGRSTCVSAEELRRTMATTDPEALGVPSWALEDVRRAEPNRRLEGLFASGSYDVAPGTSARDVLSDLIRRSTPVIESSGLVEDAAATRQRPYQVLVVASLVEREGVSGDFGRISRVIYNRLASPMRLQFDSTINYPLDRPALLTTPVDRARPGPYNTYLDLGLTPTPIGVAGPDALSAALRPPPGPWVYFVKCQTDGTSCFAVTQAEHDANIRTAQERGVF